MCLGRNGGDKRPRRENKSPTRNGGLLHAEGVLRHLRQRYIQDFMEDTYMGDYF